MFSIIMPVWNRARIVERAINSVLSQTFKDYELIIIDDGSEDDLERIVHHYLSKNVKYFKIVHQGVSAARNYGIKHSTGEFIAYLDSDNTWHPEFLSEMSVALNNRVIRRDAAYCMCNLYRKDPSTGIHLYGTRGKEFVFNDLKGYNYIDLNTFVHSKKCIEDVGLFDTQLKRLVDWDFILRITSKYTPRFIKKTLVDYYCGIDENAISIKEDGKLAYQYVRNKHNKQVTVVHDTIHYCYENVSNEKYINWLAMKDKKIDTVTFKAAGFPYMLQIEPTNTCNLKCPLCPVGSNELNRKPRHMKLEEFISLIDDMREYLLFLILWDWGEPFMNPEFPDMIKYASDMGIKTVTSTNAHFLHNDEYVTKILTSGLSTLIVAIDSLKEDQYVIYRRKGTLNKAISGLKNVIRLKRELKSDTLINLRMVIMKQNEHELKDMKRLAKNLRVDRFTVKTLNPSCGLNAMDEELAPRNPRYRRYKYKENTFERIRIDPPCRRIWFMSNIFSNGAVVPCCYDFDAKLKIGNILEKPFNEIWNSPAYQELRKRIFYNKDSIPRCRECTINFELSDSGWFVEYYDFNTSLLKRLINAAKRYYRNHLKDRDLTRFLRRNLYYRAKRYV